MQRLSGFQLDTKLQEGKERSLPRNERLPAHGYFCGRREKRLPPDAKGKKRRELNRQRLLRIECILVYRWQKNDAHNKAKKYAPP